MAPDETLKKDQIIGITSGILAIMSIVSFLSTLALWKKPEILISLGDELTIEEHMGVLNVNQLMTFKNVGSGYGSVLDITSKLTFKEDSSIFNKEFKGKFYFGCTTCSTNITTPFNELFFNSSDFASFTIVAVQKLKTKDRDKVDSLFKEFNKEIAEKDLKDSTNKLKLLNVSDTTRKVIYNYIREKLSNIQPGKYKYLINIKLDKQPTFTKIYEFYIRQPDIDILMNSIIENEQLLLSPIAINKSSMNIRLDN